MTGWFGGAVVVGRRLVCHQGEKKGRWWSGQIKSTNERPTHLEVGLLRGAPSRCCLCRSSSACGLVPISNGVGTCAVSAGSQSFGDSTSETDIVWTNARSCFGHDIELTKFRHVLYGAPFATDGTRITIY